MKATSLAWHATRIHEEGDAGYLARWTGSLLCGFARLMTTPTVEDPHQVLRAPAERQRIYIANHASHADFLLLWSALPPRLRSRTRPVAAADYWRSGNVRRYLAERVFRSVLLERANLWQNRNPLQPLLAALDGGDSLIQFPEGTRGSGAEVAPFRCGIYHLLAARPHAEIVPVWIGNLHRVLPRGCRLPVPLPCTLRFGQPFVCDPAADKAAILERLRRSVARLGEQCPS